MGRGPRLKGDLVRPIGVPMKTRCCCVGAMLLLLVGCQAAADLESSNARELYKRVAGAAAGSWVGYPALHGRPDRTRSAVPVSVTFGPSIGGPAVASSQAVWPIGSLEITAGGDRYAASVHDALDCSNGSSWSTMLGFTGVALEASESEARPLKLDAAPGWTIRWHTDESVPVLELVRIPQEEVAQLVNRERIDWSSWEYFALWCERRDG